MVVNSPLIRDPGYFLGGKMVALGSREIPMTPRELTYPSLGKGKAFSKVPWDGICYSSSQEMQFFQQS